MPCSGSNSRSSETCGRSSPNRKRAHPRTGAGLCRHVLHTITPTSRFAARRDFTSSSIAAIRTATPISTCS